LEPGVDPTLHLEGSPGQPDTPEKKNRTPEGMDGGFFGRGDTIREGREIKEHPVKVV
jgi:hypothetical protein